jgi:hypothetical protein
MYRYTPFFFGLAIILAVAACKGDDTQTCVTCSSPNTSDFQVCDEGGNASVNGENTGTSFDIYIAGLEAAGANCGGG